GIAESSVRGAALTKDERLLAQLEPAFIEIRSGLEEARSLTRDNAEQQRRLASLEPDLARRIALLRGSRDRVSAGAPPETVIVPESIELGYAVRYLVDEMIQTEQELLAKRSVVASEQTSTTLRNLWAVFAATLLFGLVSALSLVREARHRQQAEAEVSKRQE